MPLNPIIANEVLAPITGTAAAPSISFGGSGVEAGSSGTGIYGTFGQINFAINGTNALALSSTGLVLASGLSLSAGSTNYSGSASFQVIGPDLNLAATAGKDIGTGTAYLAPIMGNLIGDSLTKTGNYLGGLIGAYSVTGVQGTTQPAGAVLGQITDGVTDVTGAFVAYIDGDSAQTKAGAAFKAMSNNSTAGSGFNYGLDLYGAAHDGYSALAILKADIRLASQAVVMTRAGVPSTAGTGFAGKGSIYIDTTNGKLYVNGGTSGTPDWKIVTSA